VALNFGGSQTLRFQIEKGAPADIFSSASAQETAALKETGFVSDYDVIAETDVALIVPADNPRRIERLAEIHRAKTIVLAHPTVPIGAYTETLIRKAELRFGKKFREDITSRVVSRENSVRKVRAKVAMGEADAAFVYASDITPNSGVKQIRIPSQMRVRARYVSAQIQRGQAHELATQWSQFIKSQPARAILEKHGFSRPSSQR